MLRKISNHPVLMTWLSFAVQYGAALFILPLALVKLNEQELALWLLFNTLYGLAMLADTGLGHTLVRATAYFYAGATALPNQFEQPVTQQNNGTINTTQLGQLYYTAQRLYILVGLFLILLLGGIGYFMVRNLINLGESPSLHWGTFGLLILASYFRVMYARYASFIQGINQVAYLRRMESAIAGLRIVLYAVVLLLNCNLLGLLIADVLYSIVLFLSGRRYCRRFALQHFSYLPSEQKCFNKALFNSIWPSSWRFGLAAYGAYFITNGVSLLIAQIDDAPLIAAYLLTIRIIGILKQVSQAPMYAYLPNMISLFSQQQWQSLKQNIVTGISRILTLAVLGLIALILLGNPILEFMSVESRILDSSALLLIGLTLLLDLHHSAHVQVFLFSNKMPFLLPALISGLCIFGIGHLTLPLYGLWGLLWTQFIVQLCCNNWYPVYLSLKLLNWPANHYWQDLSRAMLNIIPTRIKSYFIF